MIIKKVLNKLDEKIKEKKQEKEYRLLLIKVDDTKENNAYIQSIYNAAKGNNISVASYPYRSLEDIKTLYPQTDKILLLNTKNKEVEKEIKELIKDKDIERNYQVPIVRAVLQVVDEIEAIDGPLNILSISRSKTIGLPVALKLIEKGHTVTIAHSNSDIFNISKDKDLVLNLSGEDIEIDNENIIDIRDLGRLTSKNLILEVMK